MSDSPLTPQQSHQMWADYYNEWFGFDQSILKKIIDEGETSLPRALNRYHHVVYSTKKSMETEHDGSHTFKRDKVDYSGFDNLLPTGKPAYVATKMLGIVVPLPFYVDPDGYASRYLIDVISQDPPQAVIDLGAGDGIRLFELDMLGVDRNISLYAAEQSENARGTIRMLCELDPGMNISAHKFSFEDPDFSFVKERESILVFSYMSLMFLKQLNEDYIVKLSKVAKKVKFIHFEPFGHQINMGGNPASEEQAQLFYNKEWNMNFVELLHKLRDAGIIHNLHIAKDVFFTKDPTMPNCILSWECF